MRIHLWHSSAWRQNNAQHPLSLQAFGMPCGTEAREEGLSARGDDFDLRDWVRVVR